MDKDFWPDLANDKYAQSRVKKSCELLRAERCMVLDVGCHLKEAAKYLPSDCRYVGLDALYGDDIDGGNFDVVSPKFDRVLCLEVLEHLKSPKSTLKSIAERLTDEGVAVISLPNESTIFHRLRALFGIVDAECFSECGKHLHLPSLGQCRRFLEEFFDIKSECYYIAPSARGSRQEWLGQILKLIPDKVWQLLADNFPSLFARGFIFVLSPKAFPSDRSRSNKART